MRIATCQFDADLGQVPANLRRVADRLAALRPGETDVLVFPEMCDTGYGMAAIVEHAVAWEANHLDRIRTLARELRTAVVIGVSERVGEVIYNTTAIIGTDGSLRYAYRKTHLVSIRPMEEHLHLTPGDALGYFGLSGLRAGVMTCYELRFPEVARTLTLRGIQVLFVPAAWPLSRVDHLTTLLRARAIENQIFVVSSCRVGTDAGTQFSGHSLIIDPTGRVLAEGSATGEDLLQADIDLADIDRARAHIGALGERRPELYSSDRKGPVEL
ncbi:nitrilase-related carbon-nitrogen hydrolase [Lewinella sp. IMCC34183]|uniref:nitrilase-related carbon-nitrogen hydrolase n=1 Tax=Lewinella sp. IMCC34183 TaxID=2248762 RepID=UPI000E24F3F5|nr:nitrilase-related carbon-nitrogen hydrolase [Lewinella sp. IMCC34183]